MQEPAVDKDQSGKDQQEKADAIVPVVENTVTSSSTSRFDESAQNAILPKDEAELKLDDAVRDASIQATYRNNLLFAIGWLDLANALDFPANVWNQIPSPLFAKVLMGLGGSIAILTTAFAFWDMHRGRQNVKFLKQERAYLKRKKLEQRSSRMEQAWLDINFRELGWELIDRMALDISLAVAGVFVGAGTLMAIRGDIPQVFDASNLLSGYIGNSIVAAYAVLNAGWSVYMWRRASRHDMAVANANSQISPEILKRLRQHSARHKWYAALTGITIVVSGVGSEISATMWPGYVVLIPCIISSVLCNFYWRHCVNYNREEIRSWVRNGDFEILQRLGVLNHILRAFASGAGGADFCGSLVDTAEKGSTAVFSGLQDLGLFDEFCSCLLETQQAKTDIKSRKPEEAKFLQEESLASAMHNPSQVSNAANECIQGAGRLRFRDEERFLLELYGCFLCAPDSESVGQPEIEEKQEHQSDSDVSALSEKWDSRHAQPCSQLEASDDNSPKQKQYQPQLERSISDRRSHEPTPSTTTDQHKKVVARAEAPSNTTAATASPKKSVDEG